MFSLRNSLALLLVHLNVANQFDVDAHPTNEDDDDDDEDDEIIMKNYCL